MKNSSKAKTWIPAQNIAGMTEGTKTWIPAQETAGMTGWG